MSKLVEDIKLIIENEDIEDLCSYSYISYDIDVDDINKNENIEESFKDYILENDCCLSNKADKSNTTKEKLNKFELEEINYWVDDLYKLLGFNLENFDIERSNRADKLINKLEENGTVYYMNGKNGTEFDWYVNEHLPSFMVFYNDGQNLGAVKLLIYTNGGVVLYIYGDKGNKVIKEVQTSIEVTENELFNLAVILRSEADEKSILDASIDKINTDVEITEEQITKFQDTEQYMEPTKNRMKLLNQTAYLSKKILEESWKVGYMYRAEPVNENDSGWSFMAGNESREYTDDYKNIALVSVHEVYQLNPDIWNYIDNPVGSELIRISSNEFEIDKRDKEIFMEKRKV